ncbi:alpha/beta fold hydrolase [Actinopolymorpha pittospori]|uniref:Pimeloyl-ACP methyl ester carboxylesterase n=1 Tax=Actinopolymorpha pittospori TaxID=648752 RepID=A0A927MP46_9ACTN|nr:alpha/beta hydrolase [Actinopolymorpha pittospori]MBE1604281.1 pimeloyl-ACP methyl ester carboxylesterase [Actinopolymorpha pittospori]
MPFITAADGTLLAYEDYGSGPTVVFIAGWALSADMWEHQVPWFVSAGHRCVLLDRRGHARSQRPSTGYDLDTLSDDIAALLDQLDLRDVTLVGHSFGGVEVAHHLSRHGSGRVARAVFLAACLPSMRRSEANPDGLPQEVIDATMAALRADRQKWLHDGSQAFFATHLGNDVSPALIDDAIRQCLNVAPMAALAVQETNLAAAHEVELAELDLPVLVLHGAADASALVQITGRRTAAIVPGAVYREYPTAGHGLYITHAETINADIAEFIKA